MGRRRKGELPRYRLHKQSGQAIVSLPLGNGKYRDVLLGPFGSEDSQRQYTRAINEWIAAGMLAPPRSTGSLSDLTVAELCLRFWKYAERRYRLIDGSPSRELEHFKYALQPLVDSYGGALGPDFRPPKLKAPQQQLIDGPRPRPQAIHQRIDHLQQALT